MIPSLYCPYSLSSLSLLKPCLPLYPTSYPLFWSVSGAVRMLNDRMGDSDDDDDNCDDVTGVTVTSDTTAAVSLSLSLSLSDKASRIPNVGTLRSASCPQY